MDGHEAGMRPASNRGNGGRPASQPRGRDLTLNALRLELSDTTVEAWVSPFDASVELESLRQDARGRWEYWRSGNNLCAFRIDPNAEAPAGERQDLAISDNLGIIARLVTPAVAALMPEYPPLRRRPYRFRGRRPIVEGDLGRRLGLEHPLLARVEVSPRYEFDGRILEVEGTPQVVLTIGVTSHWQIRGTVADLAPLDLPLHGCFVVWSEQRADGRRLAGQITSLSNGTARLIAGDGQELEVDSAQISLEPSRPALTQLCARAVGDAGARRFINALVARVNEFLAGPAMLKEVRRVGRVLATHNPIVLTDRLFCTVSEPVIVERNVPNGSVTLSRPVNYCFDPSRTKRDEIAWRGPQRYGPFSGDTFARRSPAILVVHPRDAKGQVEGFVQAFRDGIQGQGLSAYQRGFTRTFGLVDPRFLFAGVELGYGTSPGDAYRNTIEDTLAAQSTPPEAAIVVLRDEDADLPDSTSPYLHAKAALLMAGVPVQEIRLSKLPSNANPCSTCFRTWRWRFTPR